MSEEQEVKSEEIQSLKQPETQKDDPAWLAKRLEEARSVERKRANAELDARLKTLGAASLDDLQAKIAKLGALETERLTDAEKIQRQLEELTPKAERADRLQKIFSSVVESKFNALSDKQREAIDSRANGDPEKRWEFIEMMQAAGAFAAPEPRPANTAPLGAPLPPNSPVLPQTAREKRDELAKRDPISAALFSQMNSMAISQS